MASIDWASAARKRRISPSASADVDNHCTADWAATDEEEDNNEQNELEEGEDAEDGYFEVVVVEADYGINATTADGRHAVVVLRRGAIRYADFDVRSEELHTEDFSWGERCFSLVKRYFAGVKGRIIEDLFYLTNNLTYRICHDDYDYRQVNTYLNRPTKNFLCTPWKARQED
ncbi:hypothetical protein PF010_g29350 [Phytophthora fragariae]|uniref:Uncharacterized protein n=1 Tax=Phytophthora fragariae TaxID=53985 RepID=A0A6A3DQ35_9STRA|nr:hypothetical protein PF003_g29606 [Phytophthora fragariae]KAE8920018.1 hypothetical protein PF009_g29683 [Phytophthora fragariae]KAE9062559.1 hypothetical protein PF010_g29350 [Phytophthora fragariae]